MRWHQEYVKILLRIFNLILSQWELRNRFDSFEKLNDRYEWKQMIHIEVNISKKKKKQKTEHFKRVQREKKNIKKLYYENENAKLNK